MLPFQDPGNLHLEIVEDDRSENLPGWKESDVPPDGAIHGFWGANLLFSHIPETAEILTDILGFEKVDEFGHQVVFESGSHLGHSVILEKAEELQYGKTGRV